MLTLSFVYMCSFFGSLSEIDWEAGFSKYSILSLYRKTIAKGRAADPSEFCKLPPKKAKYFLLHTSLWMFGVL